MAKIATREIQWSKGCIPWICVPEQAGNDMSLYISLLNNMAVSFLGGILSAPFCNALSTRKRKLIFIGCMVLLPLIQRILYFSKGADFVRHIYPLAVHLPLVIVLWMLTGKLLWSVFLYRRHTCAANLEDGLHLPQFKCTEEYKCQVQNWIVPGTCIFDSESSYLLNPY